MIRGLLSKDPSLAEDTTPKKAGGCPYTGLGSTAKEAPAMSSAETLAPPPKAESSSNFVPTPMAATPVQAEFDVMTPVSHESVDFEMVTLVLNYWEKSVKTIPNWLEVAGELVMRQSFLLEPETKDMFGFPNAERHDPELSKNRDFIMKGVRLVEAVDTALSFLGPDLEPLENVLFQLGTRHVARRCRPRHWPFFGEVLFYIFEVGTGDAFTPQVRAAWVQLYNFLG